MPPPLLQPTATATSLTDIVPAEYWTAADGDVDFHKLTANLYNRTPPSRTEVQAKKVLDSAQEGYSSVYKSHYCGDQVIETVHKGYDNLVSMHQRVLELYGDEPCLGRRIVHEDGSVDGFVTYQTYNEVFMRRMEVGSGIRALVGRPDNFVVSIYAPNRPEWLVTVLACQSHSMTYTALYDTLGPSASAHILSITDSPVCVTLKDRIIKLVNLKKANEIHTLKFIVTMDTLDISKDFPLLQLASSVDITLIDYTHLEELGCMSPLPLTTPTPSTVFGISFTSGTTGNPKGVVIRHAMQVAYIAGIMLCLHMKVGLEKKLKVLCFLPLAHIYEVTTSMFNITIGSAIVFPPNPDPATLLENLRIVKPTMVSFVPRVFGKIEASLKQSMATSAVGRQILAAIEKKVQNAVDGEQPLSYWVDKLGVSSIRKKLGLDECAFALTASAPISSDTGAFLRSALGMGFAQGYGLTEACAGVSVDGPWEKEMGCGSALVTMEFKLRDLPEMGYVTHDDKGVELEEPRGEIMLRGPQIMSGYYKNPEATSEAFENGWYKTGDVAKLDKRGRIHIIDRAKNFFKLAQGEFVTPEKVENAYLSFCPFLTQMVARGDPLQTFLVAIVGVDPVAFRAYLSKIGDVELSSLTDSEQVETVNGSLMLKRSILVQMNKSVQSSGLQGFEKIHNLKFAIEPMSVANGTLTPTLKIKRPVASKMFKSVVQQLYEEGSLLSSKL